MATQTVDETVRTWGLALRAKRKALGISMTVAAEAAQMSRVTWHRLEKGEPGVAWGFFLGAANSLGLDVRLGDQENDKSTATAPPSMEEWLPLRIALSDFSGLSRLAWSLRSGVESLSPREAWELYERNGRHLDAESLSSHERQLMRALSTTFGGLHAPF